MKFGITLSHRGILPGLTSMRLFTAGLRRSLIVGRLAKGELRIVF